jgi:hypothetical protein
MLGKHGGQVVCWPPSGGWQAAWCGDVREGLKNAGRPGGGAPVTSWQAMELTDAQKGDARFYPENARVYFVRGYGRFARANGAPRGAC